MNAKAITFISKKLFQLIEKAPGSDRTKSVVVSTLLFLIIMLLLFILRFWPPNNIAELVAAGGGGGGVSVNFGDTDLGKGTDFQSKELDVKQQPKPTQSQPEVDDNIIAQDNSDEDAPVVTKTQPKTKKPTPIIPKEIKPEKPKPVEAPKPIVRKTDDALENILKGKNKGGDGNSNSSGNQGRANGDINSNGYDGSGGSGGGTGGGRGTGNGTGSGSGSGSGNGSGRGSGNGSGYSLSGRQALSKPAPAYNCNEEGKVVVEISVDRNGKVISATPGVQGTTNTAQCLLSQAKIAAMNTKWSASENAPEKQVGKIVYNFSQN